MKSSNDEITQPDKEKQNFNLILSYRNSAGIDKTGLLMRHDLENMTCIKRK